MIIFKNDFGVIRDSIVLLENRFAYPWMLDSLYDVTNARPLIMRFRVSGLGFNSVVIVLYKSSISLDMKCTASLHNSWNTGILMVITGVS